MRCTPDEAAARIGPNAKLVEMLAFASIEDDESERRQKARKEPKGPPEKERQLPSFLR